MNLLVIFFSSCFIFSSLVILTISFLFFLILISRYVSATKAPTVAPKTATPIAFVTPKFNTLIHK